MPTMEVSNGKVGGLSRNAGQKCRFLGRDSSLRGHFGRPQSVAKRNFGHKRKAGFESLRPKAWHKLSISLFFPQVKRRRINTGS